MLSSNVVTATILACCCLPALTARAEDAPPTIDCDNARSTYEMNACADNDFQAADKDLNRAYRAALKAVPDMATDPPYDAKGWEAALRASQRAWVAFRDAECQGHVAMFWSGGSGATVDIVGCMTAKTKERTKELADRYEDR